MGKVCLRCNTRVQDDARFCPNCGQMAFRPMRPEEEAYNYPPSGAATPGQGAPVQQGPILNGQPMGYQTPPIPGQPNQKKPKKQLQWWQILLIVVSCILVVYTLYFAFFFAITHFVFDKIESMENTANITDTLPDDFIYGTRPDGAETPIDGDLESMFGGNSTSDVPYTKGTIQNGVYENAWAKLRLSIPKGWREATAEEYAAYAFDDITEAGFLLVNSTTGDQFSLTFSNMQVEPNRTNDGLIEVYLENIVESYKKALEAKGIPCHEGNDNPKIIAGKYYASKSVVFANENNMQCFYARMLDGYIITFTLTTGREGPSDLLEQVQIMP